MLALFGLILLSIIGPLVGIFPVLDTSEKQHYRSIQPSAIYVDPDTGVNYIKIDGELTVRYDSNGNIMVTK